MMLAQVIFGLIPAFVLVIGAMMLPIVGASWEAILFVGAVLGSAGLCWAMFGYGQRSAKWVLLLLGIGELTMLLPLTAALSTLSEPIDAWTLAVLYLTLGPFIIGAIHVFASAKQVLQSRA
jgi:hypothetical protein